MKNFLTLSYGELEALNLEAKQMRLDRDDAAERKHRDWLKDQKDVKAVTVCFSDIEGRLHMLDYDKKHLLARAEGLSFDGSSVRGFTGQDESDLRLEIDWPAFYRLPADVFGPGKVIVFAFVLQRDGAPYSADFRGRLKALSDAVRADGKSVTAAFEIEGFLFRGRNAEQAYRQTGEFDFASSCGYFHSLPGDDLRRFIDRVAEAQRAMGFGNEKDHPEVAPSQFELNFAPAEMRVATDQAQLYKLVCRQTASAMGMTASFLPKPVAGVNGSGMHTNISVAAGESSLFARSQDDAALSDYGIAFAERILARANDICLVLNPSVNSYRRLDPAFEAPNEIKHSAIDRGSMIRTPLAMSASSARIEVRSVSPDANPYMLLCALAKIGLGMDGEDRPPPQSAVLLCGNIYDAIEALRADDVLGPVEAAKYRKLKEAAADRCARELGSIVKRGEIMFHHEVTNQFLWGMF